MAAKVTAAIATRQVARIIHEAGDVGRERLVSSYGDAGPKLGPFDGEMGT